MYFVWWRSVGGKLTPQKWLEYNLGLHNWKRDSVAAHYKLTDAQAALSLDELAKIFPAEAVVS